MSLLLEEIAVPVKHSPMSEGIATPRKKKPKQLAIILDNCTGCAGSPACVNTVRSPNVCSGFLTRTTHRLAELRSIRSSV